MQKSKFLRGQFMSDTLSLLKDGDTALYMRVYGYYKALITEGKLTANSRLPSVRRCAAELSVSRTTVEAAYMQLAADGYIISRPQSGYYVTDAAFKKKKSASPLNPQSEKNKILYDFSSLKADRESFDFNLWRRYLKSALRQDDRLLNYGEAQGERELREVIAKYIGEKRNVVCSADDIVIGAGVQSLLHILCGILGREKKIAFQDKTFYQGIAVFEDHGCEVTENEEEADIIYTSPSHTNRWGGTMPVQERFDLIRRAEKNGTLIIEDDYDNEFGYFNRPTPSLQGLDGGNCVIYIGTFSKLLLPSIRISFMVLPESLLKIYIKRAKLYNQTVSTTEQIALCQFIRDGHLSSRIKKVRRLYTQKTMLLNAAVNDVFGSCVHTYIGETGFVIRTELDLPYTSEEAALRARRAGIAVSLCGEDGGRPQILLSCSSVKAEDFEKSMKILKDALFKDMK